MHSVTDQYVLKGQVILVVEDDFLVAESIRMMLEELGCFVAGPVSTADEGCQIVNETAIQAAILDVSLGDETSEAVARLLIEKECPFIIATGYESSGTFPEDLRGHLKIHKPISKATLYSSLMKILA